jgi:hypothetical protein
MVVPEAWTFSEPMFRRYESETSDSSGDEQILFSRTKSIGKTKFDFDPDEIKPLGKKKFKKIIYKEDLLPE